ncbi:hypothetical protein D9Q98_003183 [Chlorella vulgaris]|uniref:Uncharacterized protein n=1 Tax=Chlorella vulgaris TaxID=3077 RepID=A0A9D4YYS2_CHLVU|nr:hypothetical protein D9Q98_003183 [Chlorella vulgaris]
MHLRLQAPRPSGPALRAIVASRTRTTCPLTTTAAPPRSSLSVAAAADSDAVPSEALASSTPASSSSAPLAFHEEWKLLWARFLQQAYELGHFAADPGVKPDSLDSNAGVMKRAVLSLARQRSDILHTLDPAKTQAVVKAGYPVDDRKTKNAHRRLHASILEGRDLAPADGGPAELQDLMRVFLSLAGCDTRDAALFKPLTAAATALLPDIMAAAAAEPPPDAVAQQGTARYMPVPRDEFAAAPRFNEPAGRRPSAQGGSGASRWQWQRRKEGAALPEAWLMEGRWVDGPKRSSSSSSGGRGARGGDAGRGGGGGRPSGGRGGRGGQQVRWRSDGPHQQQQDGGSPAVPEWWGGEQK